MLWFKQVNIMNLPSKTNAICGKSNPLSTKKPAINRLVIETKFEKINNDIVPV